jgi:hypothetical protein
VAPPRWPASRTSLASSSHETRTATA